MTPESTAILELADRLSKLERKVDELARELKLLYSKHQREQEKAIRENSVYINPVHKQYII